MIELRQRERRAQLKAAPLLLLRDQARAREAYELLASVYGWFTEGFATKDLKDAKTLLDELA